VSIPAGFLTVRESAALVSIGTLLAFVIVCAAVMTLRVREPNLHRPFKTPAVWIVAPLGILSCLYLMYFLPFRTWMRLLIWLGIGLLVYFMYGRSHSKLAK
jgi:APA family basic amino acid/polyamine antiporter